MSLVVRTTTKLMSPFLVAYAAYLMIYGQMSPGGGFQAGVILAVSVILLVVSHGYRSVKKRFRLKEVGAIEGISALGLVLIGITGIIFGGFFYNFLRGYWSGGTIPFFNIGVGLKVGAAFVMVFYVMLRWVESD